jgi:hypothetical protein
MTKYIMLALQADIDVRTRGLEQRDINGLTVEAHDIKPGLVFQNSDVKVTAFRVPHGELQAYGYKFQTPDRTVVISGDTSPSAELIGNWQKCDASSTRRSPTISSRPTCRAGLSTDRSNTLRPPNSQRLRTRRNRDF